MTGLAIEALGPEPWPDLEQLLPGVEMDAKGLIRTGDGSQATSREGVFAGGDIVNGGTTAAQAVADGMRAAREIDRHLR